ncbi:MAG: phenylalanine--tRNA ligase subunit beta [Ignavibacteriaceae bacterium]|nr:phenylalanine--tRNA ligase subunit beta [Ignavibacteriaceae bacterium]
MKISLNWLKQYVNIENIPLDDLLNKLTLSGLEVEDVYDESSKLKNIVVGFVKEKKKHPNADKLSVCIVSTGNEEFQVVCGAPNVEAGQKVIFAKIGAVIPNGNYTISKAKLRGVESFGMLCSESELELSDDHSGLKILDPSLQEGTPVSDALGLNDVLLEIGITPNRPDALSHYGVARDISAIYDLELKFPEIRISESDQVISKLAEIEIEDTVNCPRYSSRVVTGVKIKESPVWLKESLRKIGLRPISNVVDVTNFVMHELGQPLHAFDLDMLAGRKIIVKSTSVESTFKTLDSKDRKLAPGTLMICDSQKPVAIAGVMGGENSEVSQNTTNILIESAYFNPSGIRKTSKYLSLGTDASYRFERGTDPRGTLLAANRAAQLIAQLGDGQIAKGVIDIYPAIIKDKLITLRISRIEKILGYNVPKESIHQILQRLGIKIQNQSSSELQLSVPPFRPDLEREIDIIEEIARIYGYDNIPTVEKIYSTLAKKYDESAFLDNLKNTAVSLGFYEMINNPLQSAPSASLTGNEIALLNPQSQDMAFLRTSLISGALEVVSRNIKHGEKNLMLFEIGNVFNKNNSDSISSFNDFNEKTKFILIITGNEREKEWNFPQTPFDFYSLKGLVNSFNSKFLLDNVLNDSYYFTQNRIFDYSFDKKIGNDVIGIGGKISQQVLKQFDINQDVYCFEYDVSLLQTALPSGKRHYTDLLKFPKVLRDFAFIFDKSVTYSQVIEHINNSSSGLLKSVKIFDLFESDSLGPDKKSMAFALEFYDIDKTLTEEEIDKEFNKLIVSVSDNFNAKLRGN